MEIGCIVRVMILEMVLPVGLGRVLCNRVVYVDKDLEYADNILIVGISQYGVVPWKTNDSGDVGSFCWTGKNSCV
jgi:hypothetical protein